MTVIAFDGKTLAADRRCVNAGTLEKAPRMDDGGIKYIVIDDALASSWARGIRAAIEALRRI